MLRERRGRLPLVTAWAEADAPRAGPEVQQVIDIFQALCSHALYLELVEDAGWPVDAWESWLRAALRAELFGDPL